MVESVIDSRDVVVKGIGKYIPKLHGIMGATILGDGSVTPVVDLPELLRDPYKRVIDPNDMNATAEIVMNLPLALVVDDSLSARRSLTQFMEDSGYEVRAARDGIEAIEILDGRKPNIMLVDMEMPRMNGIDLTAHVRSREGTMDIPIIMITSRSTEKHRQQAENAGVNAHFTKPFSEDELLQEVERIRIKN
jgi:chemosensory pili system protein ChpA (sensor histidine kinase/response regulator)